MKFGRKSALRSTYPTDRFEPVIRSSICTGERTACMREHETGRLHELFRIDTPKELAQFAKDCGTEPDAIPTVY